jgi:Flp pilus assembly protein TadD
MAVNEHFATMSMRGKAAGVAALVIGALLLGGCASRGANASVSSADLAATDASVHIDLIRKMLEQQQYYAALAHIQQQQRASGNSDQLRYLEAEARRKLGEAAPAEALYRGLLNGKLAGDAYHGLGLLYAGRNLDTAVQYLKEAVRRNPTDPSARNDLGYALLRARRYAEAMPELSTAVELEPTDDNARNNLLLLLMVTGDEAGVKRVVSEAGITPDVVARMRGNARNLQARSAGPGVRK